MNEEKEYYTVYEMADRCGVTPKTVYNWIEGKGLQSYERKDGVRTCTVLSQEDVDEFLRPTITKAAKGFEVE